MKFFILLLSILPSIFPKNILIFNPIHGFSHVKFMSTLADVIADHGHNVTIFQPFHRALKNIDGLQKNKNIEILNYYPDHYEELEKSQTQSTSMFWDFYLANNWILQTFTMSNALARDYRRTAIRELNFLEKKLDKYRNKVSEVLKDKKVLEELRKRKFDVMLCEAFELSGFYVAHLLNITTIPTMSAVRSPPFNELFGQPSVLGYTSNRHGFLDRLYEVYENFFWDKLLTRMADLQYSYIREAIGHHVPNWRDLVRESPIFITNSNPYLDFAIPTTPTIVSVGGITMKQKNIEPLLEEYQKILEDRESTVLISFGSVVKSSEMPEAFKDGLIKMFEALPDVTFIWKYEKDDLKKLPKNVHLKKWVPQPALLADNRVKVFVTHGGLGSTMEVAYSGKPALVVPVFADQYDNARMLARHGGAVAYDKFELKDGEKLAGIVRDLVENLKYKENAEQLLEVLKNQPFDPKQNLMRHLELAMRFPKLRSQIPLHRGLIAHYYLDVVGFLISIGIFVMWIVFRIMSKIVSSISVRKVKEH